MSDQPQAMVGRIRPVFTGSTRRGGVLLGFLQFDSALKSGLGFGILYGALQGFIIDYCDIQPFIVTLAGLFLLRGLCFMVTLESVPIRHDFVDLYASAKLPLPGRGVLRSSALVMLAALSVVCLLS